MMSKRCISVIHNLASFTVTRSLNSPLFRYLSVPDLHATLL